MIGQALGPYQILAKLGEGGMGEVYEARDSRLNRLVAIKILPARAVADAERRRRFVQEAQLASSLQHAHIVTIFDIGSAEGTDYLAMELVRGRTLDATIPKGGLRLADAVRYGVQIADALAAAHGAGIVHRDLKPGNIMVTDAGQIKVLDFGLATLTERQSSPVDETRAKADVIETGAGMVLGTAAYMSPEQAEGKAVDARSDLFSFGAILYEMLAGQRAFRADSGPATVAAVINLDPKPLATLTSGVPEPLERLVNRCLRKDLARRAQHASDIKVGLEELRDDITSGSLQAPSPAARVPRRGLMPIASAVAAIGLIAAAAVWWARPPVAPVSFEPIPLTSLPGSELTPTFSPDGSQIAFTWQREAAQGTDVYVQVIGVVGTPLQITKDNGTHTRPSWAPDGKSIALWHQEDAGRRLVLVSPLGGPERTLLQWPASAWPSSIAWSPDSRWLAVSSLVVTVSDADQGIVFVSPATGERVEWAKLNPAFGRSRDPAFSPDGRRVVFSRSAGQFTGELYIVAVDSDGRPAGDPTPVPRRPVEASSPVWTADGRDILCLALTDVFRVRLDGSRDPEMIMSRVTTFGLARDGRRLAFSRAGTDEDDILRVDLQDREKDTIIAHSTMSDRGAVYSPDGQRIVFGSARSGVAEIWISDAGGDNALQLTHFGEGPIFGTFTWSPDGQQIAFDRRTDGNSDIFVIPSAGGRIRQMTKEPGEDARPAWSHDGRWIYFSSDRGDRSEIWRMPSAGGDPVPVTKNGSGRVVAAPDNQWLYTIRERLSAVHRVRPDGSGDQALSQEVTGSVAGVTATSRGLWFVSRPQPGRPYYALQVMQFADGVVKEVARLDFRPSAWSPPSVSPDERYVLLNKPDPRGADLLLIENFTFR